MIIKGVVGEGFGIAGELGFPTANIMCRVPVGAYVGCAYVNGEHIGSALVTAVGFDYCEAHIIGYDGDLYGSELEICNIVAAPNSMMLNFLKALEFQGEFQ